MGGNLIRNEGLLLLSEKPGFASFPKPISVTSEVVGTMEPRCSTVLGGTCYSS